MDTVQEDPSDPPVPVPATEILRLERPAFREGEWIPPVHTGNGRDLSPPPSWSQAPEGTLAHVLILETVRTGVCGSAPQR